MHHIAYMSRATRILEQADLTCLCERSSARNREYGITGLLVYDGKRFMQIIEGDAATVFQLMNVIVTDNRHDRITYIANEPLSLRQFSGWALACNGFKDNLTAGELLADVKALVSRVTSPALMAAIIGFAKLAK